MANLSQLQMPSIDTGQLSGKDGKKIKSYLFQIQEMLRYALNDIDEDNLSEELRSKIESGDDALPEMTSCYISTVYNEPSL